MAWAAHKGPAGRQWIDRDVLWLLPSLFPLSGRYFLSGSIAWKVGLLKTLFRQAPLSCILALPTE